MNRHRTNNMSKNENQKKQSEIYESSSNDDIVETSGESKCYEEDPCAVDKPCDCLYGDLREPAEGNATSETFGSFTNDNRINEKLIDDRLNYYNVFMVTGNCKLNGKLKYWVRYHVVLSNSLDPELDRDHNCIYNIRTMLYVDEASSIPTSVRTDEVNLVQELTRDNVDSGIPNTRSITHVIPLDQEQCPTTLRLKVCVDWAKKSVDDGYTRYEDIEDIIWECQCCQDYNYTKNSSESMHPTLHFSEGGVSGIPEFISYCSDDPGPCMLCNKDEFLQNEQFKFKDHIGSTDKLSYSVDVTDTCLVYMRVDVPGTDGDGVRGVYIARGHDEPEYTYTHMFSTEMREVSVSKLNTLYGPSAEKVLEYHNKNK